MSNKNSRLLRLLPHTSLLIWLSFSIYTTVTLCQTENDFMDNHYINLGLIGFSCICYLFKQPIGLLASLAMLVVGLFGGGALTPSFMYFSISGFKMGWPYFPLIICFLIINWNNLPGWINQFLSGKAGQH